MRLTRTSLNAAREGKREREERERDEKKEREKLGAITRVNVVRNVMERNLRGK